MRRRTFLSFVAAPLAAAPRSEKAGWIQVRLEGSPKEIGVQHGTLLRKEILDNFAAVKLMVTHDAKPWGFLREAAERVLWPRVEQEYRDEIDGIVEGLGRKLDRWDVVAMNAYLELVPYYTNWYDGQKNPKKSAPEHCSAFVATGSWTKDGRPVIAHNAWTDYAIGARWNVIFDIRPAKGHRILMDGMPGLIHSGDDFGVNAAGIAITETTISQFNGFDPKGIPEFVRARKAMQYAASIDDFARLMREGNNGGYANNWLVADMTRNEVASLELGLKHTPLRRSKDGYFLGANFPVDEKLAREETTFDNTNLSLSPCARRVRWEQLMAEHKGKIDIELAKRFLGDDYDSFEKKRQPNERGLCGRNDFSPRGMPPWQPPYGPAGAVQNKAADAALAQRMSLWAAMGPQCGAPFRAAQFLKEHPEFAWQKPVLKDLPGQPWTLFRAD